MTSSPAVKNLYTPSPDSLSSMTVRRQSPGTYDWSPSQRALNQDSLDNSEGLEALSRVATKDSSSSRRSSANLQKLSYSPTPLILPHINASETTKTNPKSAAPKDPYVREEGLGATMGNNLRRLANRWSYNGSEKLLNPSFQEWNLAEELSKLQFDNGIDDIKDRSTTPPKISTTGILRIQESSPLDTSSSDASLDSISQPDESRLTLPTHSRGSSTDTSSSENSTVSHRLGPSLKTSNVAAEVVKDRPRSFSGAIYSDLELRRLQQAGSRDSLGEDVQENRQSPVIRDVNGSGNLSRSSSSSFDQNSNSGQPMFPSLAVHPVQTSGQYPARSFGSNAVIDNSVRQVDPRRDPMSQPRQSSNSGQRILSYGGPVSGAQRQNQVDATAFRHQPPPPLNLFQPHLQLNSQGTPTLIPSPTNFGYGPHPNNAGLANSHLSLGNTQQLYEMMLPVMDANIARAQHLYRGAHQHSASDPAPMRDAATAALLLSNSLHGMQGGSFASPIPPLYPPLGLPTPPVYATQFFPQPSPNLQDAYNQEMINAMGRLLPQYPQNSISGGVQSQMVDVDGNSPQQAGSTGPSANNRKLGLYKTELCRSWEEKGTCRYGPKCQFAHGEDEIQKVSRHPKYKTEICRTFWVSGSCPYGKRCCFIHTELPAPGAPVADNSPPMAGTDGRARSMSTNSDPNDGTPVSLLARISAKRTHDGSVATPTTPVASKDSSTPSQATFPHSKPAAGTLRVDTTVLDNSASKQNKSAFPSFATNAVSARSPGPVTAAPDFGRQNTAMRLNIMDVNQRLNSATPASPATRHSFNGTEAGVTVNMSRPVSGGSSPFGIASSDGSSSNAATPVHSRSGSASNWGQFTNKSHYAAAPPFSHSSSPGGDMNLNGSTALSWARQN